MTDIANPFPTIEPAPPSGSVPAPGAPVVVVTDTPVEPSPERPAARTSPLAALRAKRAEALAHLYLDLPVPRITDPAIWVRYGKVDAAAAEGNFEKRKKRKDSGLGVLAAADALVGACLGIYILDGDTKYPLRDEDDEDPEWPRFGPEAASALGLEVTRAVDVCRALYMTDGDLMATAFTVSQWSGNVMPETNEAFLAS